MKSKSKKNNSLLRGALLLALLLSLLSFSLIVQADEVEQLDLLVNTTEIDDSEESSAPNGGSICGGTNLLSNPSFEGTYSAYDPPGGHPDCDWGPCNTAQMAPDWTPWWRSHDPVDPGWIIRMPEYKPASTIFVDPVRVRTGDAAQQYFTFFATHEAGFYQQVAVTPGLQYCFSIWGHSWSANDDDDAYSGPEYGQLNQRVGIDPTGGTDWQSGNIVWGPPRMQYDYYALFEVTAVAQASTITVFTYSQPDWAVKHNDVYWDDAILAELLSLNATPNNVVFNHDVYLKGQESQLIDIELLGQPGMTWTATVEPGGTLTPSITPGSGGMNDDMSLEVDSTGLAAGTYTATVRITSSPAAQGSPLLIPVTLNVILPTFSARPGEVIFVSDVDTPLVLSRWLQTELSSAAPLTWSTAWGGGSLAPSVSPPSGNVGDNTQVSVDTNGFGVGNYTNTLILTTDLPAYSSPLNVPVTLMVWPEVWRVYLPLSMGE